tara:strand:- start:78 stop:455 length:378 start_codon:yes stop_codon:yes gene_type:complete
MSTTDSLEHMISDLGDKIERNTKILNTILGFIVLIISVPVFTFLWHILFNYDASTRGELVVGGLALIYLTYSLVVKHGFWRIESISPKIKGKWVSMNEGPVFYFLMIFVLCFFIPILSEPIQFYF